MTQKPISRREFLKSAAVVGASTLLAACTPAAQPPQPYVETKSPGENPSHTDPSAGQIYPIQSGSGDKSPVTYISRKNSSSFNPQRLADNGLNTKVNILIESLFADDMPNRNDGAVVFPMSIPLGVFDWVVGTYSSPQPASADNPGNVRMATTADSAAYFHTIVKLPLINKDTSLINLFPYGSVTLKPCVVGNNGKVEQYLNKIPFREPIGPSGGRYDLVNICVSMAETINNRRDLRYGIEICLDVPTDLPKENPIFSTEIYSSQSKSHPHIFMVWDKMWNSEKREYEMGYPGQMLYQVPNMMLNPTVDFDPQNPERGRTPTFDRSITDVIYLKPIKKSLGLAVVTALVGIAVQNKDTDFLPIIAGTEEISPERTQQNLSMYQTIIPKQVGEFTVHYVPLPESDDLNLVTAGISKTIIPIDCQNLGEICELYPGMDMCTANLPKNARFGVTCGNGKFYLESKPKHVFSTKQWDHPQLTCIEIHGDVEVRNGYRTQVIKGPDHQCGLVPLTSKNYLDLQATVAKQLPNYAVQPITI